MRAEEAELLSWLDAPPRAAAVHFAAADLSWDRWPYVRLAELARRFAAGLRQQGVRRDDVVMLVQRASPAFVAAIFGSWAAGATVSCVLPPPAVRPAGYPGHLHHVLRTADPALMVVDEEAAEPLRLAARRLGRRAPVSFDEVVAGAAADGRSAGPAPETALLQFTSGSSGPPRGVRVPASSLGANVAAMHEWLGIEPGTPAVSWLPVHHDMGLVGFVIGATMGGCDMRLMQPEQFIRSPEGYLAALSESAARYTGIPNFGLAYLLRRVRPAALAGLRFDALEGVIVGAERIDPDLLERIHALLGPFGLDRRALLPAYGSAEATLAVTGLPRAEQWTVRELPVPTGAAGDPPSPEAPVAADRVVGCGRPLRGCLVRIVDDQGGEVADGMVGEIEVRGPSLAAGYAGDTASGAHTRFAGAALKTGDAGFLVDGQLYVLGRLGDALKVHGRMVFAEHVEAELTARGIPPRRAVALLGERRGVRTAAVLLETPEAGWLATAAEVLRECAAGVELLVVDAPRGVIALTSSGKPRRRQMWRAFCDGSWSARVLPAEQLEDREMAG